MKNQRVIGLAAIGVIAALVIAGLFAVGSPATARKLKIDQQRTQRLSELHTHLAGYIRNTGSLPASLSQIRPDGFEGFSPDFDPRKDPQTGMFFEYHKLSDRKYQVCAFFLTSSNDGRRGDIYQGYYELGPPTSDGYAAAVPIDYKPGRNCFTRTIVDREVTGTVYLTTGPDGTLRFELQPVPEGGIKVVPPEPAPVSPVPAGTASP